MRPGHEASSPLKDDGRVLLREQQTGEVLLQEPDHRETEVGGEGGRRAVHLQAFTLLPGSVAGDDVHEEVQDLLDAAGDLQQLAHKHQLGAGREMRDLATASLACSVVLVWLHISKLVLVKKVSEEQNLVLVLVSQLKRKKGY